MIELLIFCKGLINNSLAKYTMSTNVYAGQIHNTSNNPSIFVWVALTSYWLDNS